MEAVKNELVTQSRTWANITKSFTNCNNRNAGDMSTRYLSAGDTRVSVIKKPESISSMSAIVLFQSRSVKLTLYRILVNLLKFNLC